MKDADYGIRKRIFPGQKDAELFAYNLKKQTQITFQGNSASWVQNFTTGSVNLMIILNLLLPCASLKSMKLIQKELRLQHI